MGYIPFKGPRPTGLDISFNSSNVGGFSRIALTQSLGNKLIGKGYDLL